MIIGIAIILIVFVALLGGLVWLAVHAPEDTRGRCG